MKKTKKQLEAQLKFIESDYEKLCHDLCKAEDKVFKQAKNKFAILAIGIASGFVSGLLTGIVFG